MKNKIEPISYDISDFNKGDILLCVGDLDEVMFIIDDLSYNDEDIIIFSKSYFKENLRLGKQYAFSTFRALYSGIRRACMSDVVYRNSNNSVIHRLTKNYIEEVIVDEDMYMSKLLINTIIVSDLYKDYINKNIGELNINLTSYIVDNQL